MIHIRDIDPRLLAIFDAVFVERSVTQAAQQLGVTQSTVSHALNRLRDLLKDDLFLRGPKGMQPTPRALEIGPRLHRALGELQAALSSGEFVPEQSDRTFTLICTAYTCQVFIPQVAAAFREEAPLAHLRIRYAERSLAQELEDGRADIAIGISRRMPATMVSEPLFHDQWVAVVRADLAPNARTADDLRDLPHVAMMSIRHSALHEDAREPGQQGRWKLKADDRSGADLPAPLRNPAAELRVPDPAAALAVIRSYDAVAIVPRRLALAAPHPEQLRLFELQDRDNLNMSIHWLKGGENDPGLQWMRALLRRMGAAF